MSLYFQFTKAPIGVFVLISAAAGYFMGQAVGESTDLVHFLFFLIGVYAISAGSLALNQVQEVALDQRMPRTRTRPLPTGVVRKLEGVALSVGLILVGLGSLLLVSPLSSLLGLATVVMYNGFYTLYWKPKMSFGAIPGAIPGAMPVVIGYVAKGGHLLDPECVYLFLLVFLWQMPHFWTLAIRFREDYSEGGVPVLPASRGLEITLYYIGLYLFAYVGLAVASPWFVPAHYVYLLVVLPLACALIWQFFRFFNSEGRKNWFVFFMWTNASVILFLLASVLDKWTRFSS